MNESKEHAEGCEAFLRGARYGSCPYRDAARAFRWRMGFINERRDSRELIAA